MSYGDQRIPFPAARDYGSRTRYPTLAVVWHVAEGRDVAQYLSRDPTRGVSVHYTVEQATDRWRDGEVVRCLPEQRISGSVNPDTIRTSDGPYFGARHAKDALGRSWRNPNVAVISVEVAGRAAEGPTVAQVGSMVALFWELERRWPGIVPLGHADLQSVKPCPGTSPRMKRAFSEMGGHGLAFEADNEEGPMSTVGYQSDQVCDVREGTDLFDAPSGRKIGDVGAPLTRDFLGRAKGGRWALVDSVIDGEGRTAWVRSAAVSNVRAQVVTPADCADAVADARGSALAEAVAALQAIAP